MMVTSVHQLSKFSCEVGIAHILKMKKKRKAGEKGTTWQHGGNGEQQLEESLEQRTMEGSSFQLEVRRKVLELRSA